MFITTNGGQTYEVYTADEVIELLSGPQPMQRPIPRTREQLLTCLADLAAEAGRSEQPDALGGDTDPS